MRQKTVILMVKEPRPGRVKTRLGRDIGMTTAAWWFRHQTKRLLRDLRDPRWRVVLAVSPDRQGLSSRVWPGDLPRLPQGPGDLGDRMARLIRSCHGPTLVIGADIPNIQRTNIQNAFVALGRAPSVLGPAPDGGYWLVGLRHPKLAPSNLLSGVRWSSENAMEDTRKTLPQPVALTEMLRDVDTVADLRKLTSATRT